MEKVAISFQKISNKGKCGETFFKKIAYLGVLFYLYVKNFQMNISESLNLSFFKYYTIFFAFLYCEISFSRRKIYLLRSPKTLETNRNCKHVHLAFFFAFLVHYKILRDQGKISEFRLTWKWKFAYKMRKKFRFSLLTFHLQTPQHAYSETFLQLIIKLIFLISRWPKKWYTEISRGPSR